MLKQNMFGGMVNKIKVANIFIASIIYFQTSFSQEKYRLFPTYKNVVQTFFQKYSTQEFTDSTKFKFEKKPDGWHVTLRNYMNSAIVYKDQLFWDLNKKAYVAINFEKFNAATSNEKVLGEYYTNWDYLNFDVCPYYGYSGWEKDVINEYSGVDNLSDSALYGLGRAYSSTATTLLNINSDFASPNEHFVLAQGKNCLSPEQLALYRKYRHAAIKTFKRVKALNPKYETIVGKIGIKLSNEYLSSFLDLRIYQNEQEAMKELEDGLYDDFYLSSAKNYLNSCDKNAILITYGDNDTYPLLYLQVKYNIRPDVLVVNYSLLQTERYINSLRTPVLQAASLPISFSPNQLKEQMRDVIYIKDERPDTIELKELIKFIRDDKNLMDYSPNYYSYISTKNVKQNFRNKEMKWILPFSSYFLKNQLVILDVISNNKNNRPICISMGSGSEVNMGLEGYFQLEGIVYKLVPEKEIDPANGMAHINASILYEKVMNKFEWKGNDLIYGEDKLIVNNYARVFYWLAYKLIEDGDSEKAKKVIAKYFNTFPNTVYYYDSSTIYLIYCLYRLNDFEAANKIAEILINNLEQSRDNYSEIKIRGSEPDTRSETLEKLKQQAKDFNQTNLLKKINTITL